MNAVAQHNVKVVDYLRAQIFPGSSLPLSLSEPSGTWVHHTDPRICARDSLLFGLTCHRAARAAEGGAK